MTEAARDYHAAPSDDASALLAQASTFLRANLEMVTYGALSRPTPCAAWDLRALLWHVADSIAVVHEAVDVGHVPLASPFATGADPVVELAEETDRLLGACADPATDATATIGGVPLAVRVVVAAGAIDVAVHGWDIARACGRDRPIPPSLAGELLRLARVLVSPDDRPTRFAESVRVPVTARASDRLLAFLGRRPCYLDMRS